MDILVTYWNTSRWPGFDSGYTELVKYQWSVQGQQIDYTCVGYATGTSLKVLHPGAGITNFRAWLIRMD